MRKPPENKMIDYSNIENKTEEPLTKKDLCHMMSTLTNNHDPDKIKKETEILYKHLTENKTI